MNEDEWFQLQKDVQKEIILSDHFGELLASKKNGENNYSITVRCPHCSQVITYNNFHQRILGVFKLACRHCNQVMDMTPLAFGHVKDDYARNLRIFEIIKEGAVPVVVTPCMNEAEFTAMAEIYLGGVNIVSFMDISDHKSGKVYFGKNVLKRDIGSVMNVCKGHYFVIPLTRFANRIVSHLESLGVDSGHICRLDEIILSPHQGALLSETK